jgi:hypothetical protein
VNPYSELESKAFWKLAVSSKSAFDIEGLWDPKFFIRSSHKVATYGSCFAQYIGNALKSRGYNWLITEHPPKGLSKKNIKKFNYNVFSSRTGNIYTATLLEQWVEWALEIKSMPEEYWESDGRFYDPFRPRVEPNGFSSLEEMRVSQKSTLSHFRNSLLTSDFFVFTLGLTESWVNETYGYEYPMCPGTVAGEYKADEHTNINQNFKNIQDSLIRTIDLVRKNNKGIKFLLTVSPVPLTATMTGKHVITATIESKSILRAVAGQVASHSKVVDYFPSYEIINSPVFKGMFFEPNLRNVNPHGVNIVMNSFFKDLSEKFGYEEGLNNKEITSFEEEVCEEELLDAFGVKK